MSTASSSTPRDRSLLLGICALAFVLRLLVVWACADAGLFSDMQEYYDRARYLVEHGALIPDAFRPPAYPVFLAGLLWLFGDQALLAARIVQALLGAASVGLTGLLAQQLAGPQAGRVAAAIVAVYPAWLIYPVYIMAETPFTFLTLLGLWLWSRRDLWSAVLAGLALALAVQMRAAGVATVAGIGAASLWLLVARRRERSLVRPALLAAACALALAPWVVRNARLSGEFILTDTASGWNFVLGNNPIATGRLELDHIPIISERYWRGATTDVQRHKLGLDAGSAFIREHPGQWLVLSLRKLGFLAGLEGREHAWAYSYHYHGRRAAGVIWAWGLALLISFPLVMIAGLIGMFRPGATDTRLGLTVIAVLLFAAGVHVGSFGESRFHVPWVPLLAVMASTVWMSPRWGTWPRSRRLAVGVLVGALAALWIAQAPDLLQRLSLLASSPTPLALPY